jgi:hypothetical protein
MPSKFRNVLVIFYAESTAMEGVILACALGAVQAGALIRLRRLASDGHRLQHEGYIAPSRQDLEWADVVIVGYEPSAKAEDIHPFLELLAQHNSKLGKHLKGWCFAQSSEETAPITETSFLLQHAMREAGIDLETRDHAPTTRNWTTEEIMVVGPKIGFR